MKIEKTIKSSANYAQSITVLFVLKKKIRFFHKFARMYHKHQSQKFVKNIGKICVIHIFDFHKKNSKKENFQLHFDSSE